MAFSILMAIKDSILHYFMAIICMTGDLKAMKMWKKLNGHWFELMGMKLAMKFKSNKI